MRTFPRLAVACCLCTAMACRAPVPSAVAGCYLFDRPFFRWSIYDSIGQRRSDSSATVELTLQPARTRQSGTKFMWRVIGLDSTADQRRQTFSYWNTGPRGVHIVWSNGLSGFDFLLEPTPDGMQGRYRRLSDYVSLRDIPTHFFRTEAVRARATACPEADSVIVITGPTLVAVVPHTTGYLDSNVTDGSDLATVLDDFSFYLGATDSALAARGVRSFLHLGAVVRWTRGGRRDSLVLDPDSGVAYLFWGPTGPKVRRGVMTDLDLVEFVGDTLSARRP